jgi:cell division protein FtsW (lipid II flippase)
MEILIEIIGWLGMLLILIAYYLISSKHLEAKSVLYQLLNLFGATGIVINAFFHKAFPSLALNTIWALIAFWAIVSGKETK